MEYNSKNMNFVFYKEYFKDLAFDGKEFYFEPKDGNKREDYAIKKTNALVDFKFPEETPEDTLKGIDSQKSFTLFTQYPGLLMGTGYEHSIGVNGAIKCGFSFDFITGQPYLPGSSLKGLLRSFFPEGPEEETEAEEYIVDPKDPYNEFIKSILGVEKENINILKFRNDIFCGKDVFIGAFPNKSSIKKNEQKLLEIEYITPHNNGACNEYKTEEEKERRIQELFPHELYEIKEPTPISLIKVMPNVGFDFCFILHDYIEDEKVIVTADEKKNLFKQIILNCGAGAKTNVGFGRFRVQEHKVNEEMPEKKEENKNKNHNKNQNKKIIMAKDDEDRR